MSAFQPHYLQLGVDIEFERFQATIARFPQELQLHDALRDVVCLWGARFSPIATDRIFESLLTPIAIRSVATAVQSNEPNYAIDIARAAGTHEPAPAGALDGSGRRVELGGELVDGAPGLDDGILEGAVAEDTAVALALRRGTREVLPEEGVVDVTCVAAQSAYSFRYCRNRTARRGCTRVALTSAVELEGSLEGDALLGGGRLGVGLLGGVEGVHVGLVVLLVVKLHDLLGDVGLERIVGVGEVGEYVGHSVGCRRRRLRSEDRRQGCASVFIALIEPHRTRSPGSR